MPSQHTRSFGRYEVVRPLGRGAVGEVYLARDPALGREVAVKTLSGLEALPPEEQGEARARFLREARAAAGLSHPHIVTIHDVGEAEGVPFIAMEYLRGTTLDRYTRPGHLLPPQKVLDLGIQAALALDEAHRRGIVHRDVKPANLVLLGDGSLKVADFGLAKAGDAGLTAHDTLLGTPNYMSPEHVAGKPLDGRSDLFSLAVSLFELLSGQRPFPGDTISSVLYRIVNEPPIPLTEANPRLPAPLSLLFDRALAKAPSARPATGAAFAAELHRILDQMGGVPRDLALPAPAEAGGAAPEPARTTRQGAPAATPHGRSANRLLFAAAGLIALGVLGWALLGPLGRAIGLVPTERAVIVDTEPPGMKLAVSGDGARLVGGKVVVPLQLAESVRIEATDLCHQAVSTIPPGPAPDRVHVVAGPRLTTAAVATRPPGATVSVNGERQRGATPMDISLPLCQANTVTVTAPGRTPVTVPLDAAEDAVAWRAKLAAILLPAATASVAAPENASGSAPAADGRVNIPAPPGYAADVLLGGRRLGPAGRTFTLPVGRHTLTLANTEILLRSEVRVDVRPGAGTTLAVEWPALGSLSVRAVPAGGKVTIRPASGGAPVDAGTTPLNDLRVVAGAYEVTVEHPTSGARVVRSATVQAGAATVVRIAQEDWRS